MKKVIGFLFWTIVLCSCDEIQYSKAAQKDGQRIFKSHKEFFKSMAFEGAIADKKYCEKCETNKYQLVIDLRAKNPDTIEFSNLSYPPFYVFNDRNQLTISVTQQIYGLAEKDSSIRKEVNSDSLGLPVLNYRLLSGEDLEWLADKP